jgi:hypothetical protein
MSNELSPRPLSDSAVRVLLAVNGLLLALLFGYVGYIRFNMPDRYVVHQTTFGRPDQWIVNEGGGGWYLLPLFASVFAAVLIALALLEPRLRLHRFGMQQRARFVALPESRQWPLIRSVMLFTLTIAAIDTVVLAAVQAAIFGAGQSIPKVPAEWVVGAAILIYPLIGLPWMLVLRRHLTRALAEPSKS